MRAELIATALLVTSCATNIHITGRYAAGLSNEDVQQIKRLVTAPHVGRTVITIDAVHRDRVHVEERRYTGEGYEGSGFFALRRGGTWQVDQKSEVTAERQFLVY
jgi:hypothetical protein